MQDDELLPLATANILQLNIGLYCSQGSQMIGVTEGSWGMQDDAVSPMVRVTAKIQQLNIDLFCDQAYQTIGVTTESYWGMQENAVFPMVRGTANILQLVGSCHGR